MRRACKISERAELLLERATSLKARPLNPFPLSPASPNPVNPLRLHLLRGFSTSTNNHSLYAPSPWPPTLNILTSLFDKSRGYDPKLLEELQLKVSQLKDELLEVNGDTESVFQVLDEKGLPLFASNQDALLMLLDELHRFPQLAIEVFYWRRKQAGLNLPITHEEYSKAIKYAGKTKNVSLAVELFTEAVNNRAKSSSVYNALMAAYRVNSMPDQCQALFSQFSRDPICRPTTVTYNILISVFGRLMLVDHMEATLDQIYESNLAPNIETFNSLIAGYITAWMWDRMEATYTRMKESSIEPDTQTHLLLLRGYAHAGMLQKMEDVYELVKQDMDTKHVRVLRCMIHAYCTNPCVDRLQRIDELLAIIPEKELGSWLNVLLIRFYAQELLLERMKKFIDFAFEHKTTVVSSAVMRSVITAYYRSNVVDELADFVKRAEGAGWRLSMSLYHCKMVMYGLQNRLTEMESVLADMKRIKMMPTKKTFIILYKAYSNWGSRCKLEQVVGLMCKRGHGILLDSCPS